MLLFNCFAFICLVGSVRIQDGKSSAASESVGLPGNPVEKKVLVKLEHPGLPQLLSEWKVANSGKAKMVKVLAEVKKTKAHLSSICKGDADGECQVLFQKVLSAIQQLDLLDDNANSCEVSVHACKMSKGPFEIEACMRDLLMLKANMVAAMDAVAVLKTEVRDFSDLLDKTAD